MKGLNPRAWSLGHLFPAKARRPHSIPPAPLVAKTHRPLWNEGRVLVATHNAWGRQQAKGPDCRIIFAESRMTTLSGHARRRCFDALLCQNHSLTYFLSLLSVICLASRPHP